MLSYPSSSGTPDCPKPQHSIRRSSATAHACRRPAAIRRFAGETLPVSVPPAVPPDPPLDKPPVDGSAPAPPPPSAPPVIDVPPDSPPPPGLPLPSSPSLHPSNETTQHPTNTAIRNSMAPEPSPHFWSSTGGSNLKISQRNVCSRRIAS